MIPNQQEQEVNELSSKPKSQGNGPKENNGIGVDKQIEESKKQESSESSHKDQKEKEQDIEEELIQQSITKNKFWRKFIGYFQSINESNQAKLEFENSITSFIKDPFRFEEIGIKNIPSLKIKTKAHKMPRWAGHSKTELEQQSIDIQKNEWRWNEESTYKFKRI